MCNGTKARKSLAHLRACKWFHRAGAHSVEVWLEKGRWRKARDHFTSSFGPQWDLMFSSIGSY